MKKFICDINMKNLSHFSLQNEVDKVWGSYDLYHIHDIEECNYKLVYEKLASTLGEIRTCHPVNNKQTKFSNSRDIKYVPGVPHYYASNSRQPLHNDYAYYESTEAPDWLMIYCIHPSEFGGRTNLISTRTLRKVMSKYSKELLNKLNIDVVWKYNGRDGDRIHKKPILKDYCINWNYWQIKEEINDKSIISIKEEFFNFLENKITAGNIYDFSKEWKKGDCIIFKDKNFLHSRDSFLGDRWLKDHAFYYNTEKQGVKK